MPKVPTPSALPARYHADIERAVHILKEGGCREVFLFGSLATGEFGNTPDIDLAVTGCPKGTFFQLAGKLAWELEHAFGLVDLESDDLFSQYLRKRGGLIKVG
jgi:predicted nucleotidyltransferase